MAEGASAWPSGRPSGRKYVSKRSVRERREKQILPDGPWSHDGGGGDPAMFYLNPQTPKWSLAEKFAELSPGEEERAVDDERRRLGPELSACAQATDADHARRPTGTPKEGGGGVSVTTATAATPTDPANQRVAKVNEQDGHVGAASPEGGGGGERDTHANGKDPALLDPRQDGKAPPIFAAMKKRGVDIDHALRRYKCTRCHWAFKKFCNLQSHLETHTGRKPHVCDACGKAYSHQGTLQQHKRLHTGERPYRCPFCVKTYIWSSDYRKHIRTHTGEKPYVCGACGKDFVRSSDLRKHERNMHTNDKPFPCAECGKTFNKPLSLKRHERQHLGDTPYSCLDCGKLFALASRMAEHQKSHGGLRPHACAVCPKRFTRSSNLLEHQAVHAGARPHKCDECGAAFAVASRLLRHRHVHGGRPSALSCGGCGMTFGRPAALESHQERSCGGRIFVCTECDKAFQCSSKLAEHMLSHEEEGV